MDYTSTAFQKKTLVLGLLASFVTDTDVSFVEKIVETSRRRFRVYAYTYVVQKI